MHILINRFQIFKQINQTINSWFPADKEAILLNYLDINFFNPTKLLKKCI